MKFLILAFAIMACTQAALVSPRKENPFKVVMEQKGDVRGLSLQDREKVCNGCVGFFTKVQKYIEEVGELSKEHLTKAFKKVCDNLPEDLPGHHEICDIWSPKIIDYVYEHYKGLADNIKPQETCELLFLCQRHTTLAPTTITVPPETIEP
ncbi:unnamed protein product [Bursaphelenchus okinawaensis]|uniref:Saposin B-type domain-containing protein n=1 Tax=Bursaphelenchus okinawaensis TaxID=465554 RepID=A0A811K262_9BILA|nr:unnamed protein product [Bursaphelenchus okinawaensis]CAG9089270.1 unnamed protein product [Bursaphelenchus okinawaensis]